MLQKGIKKQLKYILLTFVFLSAYPVYSQTILFDPPKIYIGASGGVTGSMVLFNPAVDQMMLPPLLGYNGGVRFRYITEKNVGLQLEVNYSQRGWAEKSGNYTRRLDYVEMPFLSHFYMGNTHRFIINLGPKIGYLLKETVLTGTANATEEQQVKPVHFPFDYGIAAGFGYNLHTKTAGVFELETRAYYGLSDIFANTKSDYFKTSNHLNLSVNLGWYFQVTGK